MDWLGEATTQAGRADLLLALTVVTALLATAMTVRRTTRRQLLPWLVGAMLLTLIAAIVATLAISLDIDGVPTEPVRLNSGAGAQVPPPETSSSDAAAVQIALGEWDLVASTAEMPPGEVTFHIHNAGTLPHSLRIRSEDEGPRREWRTDPVAPGERATLTVDLPTGTFELDCPIESSHGEHDALGMETLLTVHDSAPLPDPPGTSPPEASSELDAPAGTARIHIAVFSYVPDPVRVTRGGVVAWPNTDEAPHSATGVGWDTGVLGTDVTGTVRFDRPGTYPYRCTLHPEMRGTVHVDDP